MLARRLAWVFGALALGVVGFLVATRGWTRFDGDIGALDVDLSRPHAYLATPALSQLPRDLVKAPIARQLLTEEFAFYYEEHEDRLGLRGALKRISFEHELTLGDRLIESVFDEPAELALWADAKGAPRHWLLAMTRGVVARALQELATIAAKDKQLSLIDSVRVNGAAVSVYALKLSARRTLALASQGDRVVVLSDPGLLFDSARRTHAASLDVIAQLLASQDRAQSLYRRGFGLGDTSGGHTLVADARLLSFGYQHFFPAMQALRLDVALGGASLRSQLRVQGERALAATPAEQALWSALPVNPAACALLPADWKRAQAVFASAPSAADRAAWTALTERLEGPAAVCWYARSQLHTPLFIAQTKADGQDPSAALAALSRWLLPAKAAQTEPPVRPGEGRWQRQVTAPWGPHGSAAAASYKPTLARQGRWLVFSADDALVDLALDAQAKRYPSVADSLPAGPATLAVVGPGQAAELMQREALQVVPPGQGPLRQATEKQLLPRLNALRQLPAARAAASGTADAQGWVALDWQELAAAPAGAPASQPQGR